jgi:hypothetical protein
VLREARWGVLFFDARVANAGRTSVPPLAWEADLFRRRAPA